MSADSPYETAERLSPRIRRILARNPSPLTERGTATYIVGGGAGGSDAVAVIDPGPALAEHVQALAAAVAGATVGQIIVTHSHADHSSAARPLQAITGGAIVGGSPVAGAEGGVPAGFDPAYRPDHVLRDGERIAGPGWTLEAVATPGHASNHYCLALAEERALFTGDHVMGWATSVVCPPDGDMAAYRESLALLLRRDDRRYYPGHGPAIDDPRPFVRGLVAHRTMRERQITKLVKEGADTVPALAEAIYRRVGPALQRAGAQTILAHLLDLEERRLLRREGGRWRVAG